MKQYYQVIVGNVGQVYSGDDIADAISVYKEYVEASKMDVGRAAGEDVVLMGGDNIIDEHIPGSILKHKDMVRAEIERIASLKDNLMDEESLITERLIQVIMEYDRALRCLL